MEFKLNINMDNAAFEDASEIERILRDISIQVDSDASGAIFDVNGNKVGDWEIAA